MVRALGQSIFVVMMALALLPSMPTLPMYAISPQLVQYSQLGNREDRMTGQDFLMISLRALLQGFVISIIK